MLDHDHVQDHEVEVIGRKSHVHEKEDQDPRSDAKEVQAEKIKDAMAVQEDIKIISENNF